MSPLNQRAAAALTRDGHMDEDRVTRRPRPGHCRHCHLAITAAITDAGFTAACWPTPTTPHGELTALLAGLRTYTANPDTLLHRDDYRIRTRNANQARVLVQHRCGDTPPPPNPIHDVQLARPRFDGPIPF